MTKVINHIMFSGQVTANSFVKTYLLASCTMNYTLITK